MDVPLFSVKEDSVPAVTNNEYAVTVLDPRFRVLVDAPDVCKNPFPVDSVRL